MITCYVKYTVNQAKLAVETYAGMWLNFVPKFGGTHHGYFMPSEGESDVALALFSFPSLAAYEKYREDSAQDPEVAKATAYWKETGCFLRYERSFFRPVFPAK